MGLRIQNNVEAFNAHRALTHSAGQLAKSQEKLSSGFRINRAADDAAGLSISEKMRGQIGGVRQAQRNAQDGISLVQTAEGSLSEVHSMLNRLRELAVQHANTATLDTDDQAAIQGEADQLMKEIARVRNSAEFNGNRLLAGDAADTAAGADKTVTLQVGANDGQTIDVTLKDLTASISADAFDWTVGAETIDLADATVLADIDAGITAVSTMRAEFGAVQNRLEHTLNSLATYEENLVASESRIRDVDMAKEMVNLTKLQVLQQAGTAMLAQANQSSQSVLSLLR